MKGIEPLVARRVELVGFDVDGVLTDGGVYVGARQGDPPLELKRFFVPDGVGIHLLRAAGLKVIFLSARVSEATRIRAVELGVDEVVQDDLGRKLPALEEILNRLSIRMESAAFVGDDLPDLPVLQKVGLPVAVSNAVPEVRAAALYVTRAAGGAGAVREVAEELLRARGQWDGALSRYFEERGGGLARTTGALRPR